MQPGVPENRLNFETTVSDAYGMPQPTFVYQPSPAAAKEAHDMMNECVVPSLYTIQHSVDH